MCNLPSLSEQTLWAILNDEIEDEIVNQLIWRCLKYRYDSTTGSWNTTQVSEDWREPYPTPPDFIASRPAIVKLTRSIPKANKQLLKEQLGFRGYKLDELVPRLTRRATMVNWLLGYMQASNGGIGKASITKTSLTQTDP